MFCNIYIYIYVCRSRQSRVGDGCMYVRMYVCMFGLGTHVYVCTWKLGKNGESHGLDGRRARWIGLDWNGIEQSRAEQTAELDFLVRVGESEGIS